MTDLLSAVKEGIKNSAPHLSTDFRLYAANSGWDMTLAQQVSVIHPGDKLQIKTKSEDVLDKEYGTMDSDPSGAIRSWAHSPRPEAVIIKSVAQSLEGLL